jgi:hypothetical protein
MLILKMASTVVTVNVKAGGIYSYHCACCPEALQFAQTVYSCLPKILTVSSDYFPEQHELAGLCSRDTVCYVDKQIMFGEIITENKMKHVSTLLEHTELKETQLPL